MSMKHRKKAARKGKGPEERELVIRTEDQCYARVEKLLGGNHLSAICGDGQTRICHIRGAMQKKVWLASGDIILVALRDFQEKQGDVIHKYTAEEVNHLKKMGELADLLAQEAGDAAQDLDEVVEFDFAQI